MYDGWFRCVPRSFQGRRGEMDGICCFIEQKGELPEQQTMELDAETKDEGQQSFEFDIEKPT